MLKLFNKEIESQEAASGINEPQQIERMEGHIRELGMEVLRLRHEVNTILSSQQSFKTALGHLRQYLEERGSLRTNERSSDQEDDGEESELEGQETAHLQKAQIARTKSGLH